MTPRTALLTGLLLAGLVALALAKDGSISNDLFEEDVKDDVIAEDEPTKEEKAERRISACFKHRCPRGEACHVDDNGDPQCACVDSCDIYVSDADERTKVCSNLNATYSTECELDRDHCLCKHGQDGCSSAGAKKVTLEYYGQCQELKECAPGSKAQFPKRLTEWLFIVLETLEERAEEAGGAAEYNALLEEARNDLNHSVAAVWGFCDLDKDPQDRSVSRRELQYTVRSLRAMEACLVPFLDTCDADDNRRITLPEWGTCLGIPHEKITDRCNKIHAAKNGKKAE